MIIGCLVGEKEIGYRESMCADLTWDSGMSFLRLMKLVQSSKEKRKAMLGATLELHCRSDHRPKSVDLHQICTRSDWSSSHSEDCPPPELECGVDCRVGLEAKSSLLFYLA